MIVQHSCVGGEIYHECAWCWSDLLKNKMRGSFYLHRHNDWLANVKYER